MLTTQGRAFSVNFVAFSPLHLQINNTGFTSKRLLKHRTHMLFYNILTIPKLQRSDRGLYTCRVTSGENTKQQKVTVTVFGECLSLKLFSCIWKDYSFKLSYFLPSFLHIFFLCFINFFYFSDWITTESLMYVTTWSIFSIHPLNPTQTCGYVSSISDRPFIRLKPRHESVMEVQAGQKSYRISPKLRAFPAPQVIW